MREDATETTGLALIKRCTIYDFKGFPTKKGGYGRYFLAKYSNSYMNHKGERVFKNMEFPIVAYNEYARYLKAEFAENDVVSVAGSLETYEDDYGIHHCIRIFRYDDIKMIEKFKK
jgi:hypothetical protein